MPPSVKILSLLPSVSGLLLVGACSSGEPLGPQTLGQRHHAIDGGELAADQTAVFGLLAHEGQSLVSCTATLIAPNLLLTAQHCVAATESEKVVCDESPFGELRPAEGVFAGNSTVLDETTQWFQAREIHVPAAGSDVCGGDIALIILRENVPANVAVPAVPRLDQGTMLGEVYAAVGYGSTRNDSSFGRRMIRRELEVICPTDGHCGSVIKSNEFLGEVGACQGDSGGPALDTAGQVLGALSRASEDCSNPVYSSVFGSRGFVRAVAERALELGGYAEPAWLAPGTTELPPDSGTDAGGAGADNGSDGRGQLGEACSGSEPCASGLACFFESAPENASCVQRCSIADDCPSGATCDGELQVCRSATGARLEEDDGGCAIGGFAARGPALRGAAPHRTALAGFVAALGFGASLMRRRRRPKRAPKSR